MTETTIEIEPTREELSALIDELIAAQPTGLPERFACVYCRISYDPQQKEAGVRRQLVDSFELAARQGFRVKREHVFVDNDVSASPLSTDPRPGYDDMMAALEAGQATGIAGYSDSRIGRRAIERLELDHMCARLGVRKMTKMTGEDDLTTASGRMVSGFKALVDQNYSEVISENVKRATRGAAEQGRLRGPAPWGWNKDGTIDEDAAVLIKEAIACVLAGEGYSTIIRRWNDAGIKPQKAARWNPQSLKVTLRNPRLVGDTYLSGEPVLGKDGKVVRGQWVPMIDRETWDRLVLKMAPKGEQVGRKGARKYLLSSFLACAVCDAPLYGYKTTTRGKVRFGYQCGKGPMIGHTVSIDGGKADEYVLEAVMRLIETHNVKASEDAETWAKADVLTEAEDKLSEIRTMYMDGDLSAAEFKSMKAEQQETVATLKAEKDHWLLATSGPILPDMTPDEMMELYEGGTVAPLRAMVERYFEGGFVKPRGAVLTFDPARLALLPR